MKTNKLPQPARYSLWAFVLFLIIVLVCRHIVSDQQQETRIEMLEVQIAQLQNQLDAHAEKWASSNYNASLSTNETSVPTKRTARQATTTPQSAHTPINQLKHTTQTPESKIDQLTEKLTDDNKNKKFAQPIRLELNTVDSLTLIRVPGIAARTASTILSYRRKLGGFYSPEQLRDKLTWEAAQNYMDEWCNLWFKADESLVQMLHINSLSFREINSHPYVSYEQTTALVRYRERHKGIHSMTELEQLAEFDEATIEKLKHYISFE